MNPQPNCALTQTDRAIKRLMETDELAGAHGALDELAERRLVGRILGAADQPSIDEIDITPLHRRRRGWRVAVVAAAIAGLCVAGWTVWHLAVDERLPSVDVAISDSLPLSMGAAEQASHPPSPPAPLSVESPVASGVIELSAAIHLVAEPSAQFTWAKTDPQQLSVVLDHGSIWIAVSEKMKHSPFVVRTPQGEVWVTGTVFGVAVQGPTVRVQVLRGSVNVLELDGAKRSVSAGRELVLGVPGTPRMTGLKQHKQWNQLVSTGLVRSADVPILPGTKKRIKRSSARKKGSTGVSNRPRSHGPSIRQYQTQIRTLRQQRDWRGVAKIYQQLIRDHRRTESAQAAMVALGTVRLEKLNDPHSGLRWFESYLATGHRALRPEAMWGKARALRAIGDRAEESKVLEKYIAAFPDTSASQRARARMSELKQHGL